MSPPLDASAAARILDASAPSPRRPRRAPLGRAMLAFLTIAALGAHGVAFRGYPSRAPIADASSTGAGTQAGESHDMKRWMAIGAVAGAGLAGANARAQDAVQWRVQDGGNGHWYGVRSEPISDMTWQQMRDAAISLGGHLITIADAAEDSFAFGYFESLQRDMMAGPLGFYRSSAGAWQWVTGEDVGYTNWRGPCCGNPAAPDNGPSGTFATWISTQQTSITGRWEDWSDAELGNPAQPFSEFLVEWDADCNNDGIVDFGQLLDGSLFDGNGNNTPDCCEQSSPCPLAALEWSVSAGGNGHWYALKRVQPSQSPESLFALATQIGGYAATIASAAENAFCSQFVVPFDGTLIGVRKLQGTNQVAWVTGEPVTFVNWNTGEGTNLGEQYALIIPTSGRWTDTDLTPRQVLLVEFSADCNADGIVDFGQIRAGELEDANGNNIPDCCEDGASCEPCPGDADASGTVDGVDLAIILSRWGTPAKDYPAADTNGDGTVDGIDLATVLGGWGACP